MRPSLRVQLGGPWVVMSKVISPLIWVIIIVTLLMTSLIIITTHEPPRSSVYRGLKSRAALMASCSRHDQCNPGA